LAGAAAATAESTATNATMITTTVFVRKVISAIVSTPRYRLQAAHTVSALYPTYNEKSQLDLSSRNPTP
jgi:hypothetical protein